MKRLFENVSNKERNKILKMHSDKKQDATEQTGRRIVPDTLQKAPKPVIQQSTGNECLKSYGFKFQSGSNLPMGGRTQDSYVKENFQFKGKTYQSASALTYTTTKRNKQVNFKVVFFKVVSGGHEQPMAVYGKYTCKDGILYLVLYPETEKIITPGDYGF